MAQDVYLFYFSWQYFLAILRVLISCRKMSQQTMYWVSNISGLITSLAAALGGGGVIDPKVAAGIAAVSHLVTSFLVQKPAAAAAAPPAPPASN